MSPSSTTSLAPKRVTVCGTFQFTLVNVRLSGPTTPSLVSLEVRAMTTLAVGCDVSTTVNVGVSPPISLVISPEVGVTTIPAVSSSVLVADTLLTSSLSKFESPLAASDVRMLYATLPSSMASETPVTVIVCGVFQLALVKVTLAALTVPSVGSFEIKPIVTSAVGCEFSTIANVAVPPASVVTRPVGGVTVMPAVSLSVLVTDTSLALSELYLPSLLAAGAVIIEYVTSPSSRKSSTPATVTVCGIFQFAVVKVTLAGPTVPSTVLLELSPIVTSVVGCEFNTTVKVAVPPASVVVNPDVGVTVMPAVSLSVLVTETSLALSPL